MSRPSTIVGMLDVKLAGPVAPLAADRVALEDRRLISVDGARHRLDPVRVAVQARRGDRPVEVGVHPLVTRGQVPLPLLDIPTDRGLEEEAVALDQVAEPLAAGAEHELDLGLVRGR